jgi:Protein of unknown function (DUF2955)/Fusaric acid resistance protein-like
MSSEPVPQTGAPVMEPAVVAHALRIAGGVAVPFIVGEALGWPLAYLSSVLALQLLASRQPPPTLLAGGAAVAAIAIAFFAALFLTGAVLSWPLLFILATGLTVFGALYAQTRSSSPFWFFFLVAVTAIPLMAAKSGQLATSLACALIDGMVVAVLTTWLMHALFPEPAQPASASAANLQGDMAVRERAGNALIGMVIVMALLLLLLNQGSVAIVVMVTALSIVRAAGLAGSTQTAVGLLLGNLIGGAVAILAYWVIDHAPSLPMLAGVLVAISLFFGERIASAGPKAPLFVVACTAAVILFGAGLSPFNDTSTAFATRVGYVMLASLYTVGMLALLAAARTRRMPGTGMEQSVNME